MNSISAVIQAHIFQDDHAPEEAKVLFPQFNVIPDLPPENGGHMSVIPEHVLVQESCNDQALRAQLENLVVPTMDTIVKLVYCFNKLQ